MLSWVPFLAVAMQFLVAVAWGRCLPDGRGSYRGESPWGESTCCDCHLPSPKSCRKYDKSRNSAPEVHKSGSASMSSKSFEQDGQAIQPLRLKPKDAEFLQEGLDQFHLGRIKDDQG